MTPFTSSTTSPHCPNCLAPLVEGASACQECGRIFEELPPSVDLPTMNRFEDPLSAKPLDLLENGTVLEDLVITRPLSSTPGQINRYLAKTSNGLMVLVKEFSRSRPDLAALKAAYAYLKLADHSALPRPYRWFESGEGYYQCFKWLDGRSLPGVFQNETSLSQQFAWMQQLCQAIHSLNEQNAICLEIKPEDLLVLPDGRLVIQDLALVYQLPLQGSELIQHSLYIAPEVYSNPAELNFRSDVYAIGAVWLTLLLGQKLDQQHLNNRALLVPAQIFQSAQVPPVLNRLLARALNRSVALRYKNPYFFGQAIGQAEEDLRGGEPLLKRFNKLPDMGAWTDQGMERDNNEDKFYLEVFSGKKGPFTIAVVADGMGGEEGGEVASQIVTEVIKTRLPKKIEELVQTSEVHKHYSRPTQIGDQVDEGPRPGPFPLAPENMRKLMQEVINQACQAVNERSRREKKLNRMGSTVVIGVVVANQVYIANVGDSRAYLLKPGLTRDLIQVSKDHTYSAEQRRNNQEVGPDQENQFEGVLSRNLGNKNSVEAHFSTAPLDPDDYLLLCCDGLTDSLTDEQIADIVWQAGQSSVLPICYSLINQSNLAEGHDNTTVVLYRHSAR